MAHGVYKFSGALAA